MANFKKDKVQLKEKFKNGFLVEVLNKNGNLEPVEIFQGMKPGFSVRYSKSKRLISFGHNNAESLARKLAKKGHKKVKLLD